MRWSAIDAGVLALWLSVCKYQREFGRPLDIGGMKRLVAFLSPGKVHVQHSDPVRVAAMLAKAEPEARK